jgi:hypothetical protein
MQRSAFGPFYIVEYAFRLTKFAAKLGRCGILILRNFVPHHEIDGVSD